jgi:hypothetical protein
MSERAGSPLTPPAGAPACPSAIKLWTTLTDPGSHGVTAVAFSRTSATIAVADANGSTYLYWWACPSGCSTCSRALRR